MNNTSLSNVARMMFCLPLFAFGIIQYMNAGTMQETVPGYMIFGGAFWTYASATSLILAGTGIAIRKWDRLAALCLAPTIFAFALMVHLPMALDGNLAAMYDMLRDTMIGAACLLYAAYTPATSTASVKASPAMA